MSQFYYARENNDKYPPKRIFGNPNKIAINNLEINDYIEWLSGKKNHAIHNIQCQFLSGTQDYDHAKDVVDNTLYLCAPTEEISAFHKIICDKFSMPYSVPRIMNEGKLRPRRADLSDNTESLIKKMFAHDFMLYEYVKQQFSDIASATRLQQPG